ncbi:DUF4279 domain-containing protein [Marinilabilia salmonicolor]|uniref:Uncharacterized protein DUF4279 n=1 Tax=Marinilabilia salmonicolor TaxID=989 RepID=A0A368UV70_9BACT|nr:DUF4279 domain-containing protein [Marinilabilia salmonicolor]RCW31950.1 uncharacterized protein DUF4279 [Marinilabilia salmonicolor]
MKRGLSQMKATLSVFGEKFSPKNFSTYIEINPTEIWNKGDEILSRSGLERKTSTKRFRKEFAWEYSLGFIETLYFDEIANKLESIFRSKALFIKSYIEKHNLNSKIEVVVEIKKDQVPSLFLSNSFISFLNDLGAEIDFDLYIVDNEK